MNLQAAQTLALQLMELHGLIQDKWFFQFNNRKNAAGICNYSKHSIELSRPLTELSDEVDVKDTILHEIAHAFTKGHHHDYVWQRKAKEIGCNGLRCYDVKSKESTEIAYNLIAKYKGVCPNGHEYYKNKMSKKRSSCSKCSPRFDDRFIITYSLNK